MKISDIIAPNEYLYSNVDLETKFDYITTDIGDIKENSLLIIPNSSKISADYDPEIKPRAVICDNPEILKDAKKIIVNNSRYILSQALRRYYSIDFTKFKTVGITGTNGKTSTAKMIKKILTECGHRVGFIGTGLIESNGMLLSDEYYSMTTPDPQLLYKSIKKMECDGCTAVIMEVSSHALALEKVSAIPFDYGIFTNLEEDHLDFHETKEAYFQAKLKLFTMCKTAIFNIDDAYARRAVGLSRTERTITVGALWRGDVYATDIDNRGFDGISYMYHGENFLFKMNLKLSGIYNTYNSLLATALCIDLGCKPCEVKHALESIKAIPGRYETINDDVTVVIDYAHTESAFEAFLKDLNTLKEARDLWIVFGCGGRRDTGKRPKMAKIAEKYSKNIIITSDNPRDEDLDRIFADIMKGFSEEHTAIRNRIEAISYAITNAKSGGIVAIIGKGCEPYYIDKQGYHSYNEKEVIKKALTERRLKKQYANKA